MCDSQGTKECDVYVKQRLKVLVIKNSSSSTKNTHHQKLVRYLFREKGKQKKIKNNLKQTVTANTHLTFSKNILTVNGSQLLYVVLWMFYGNRRNPIPYL